MPLQPLHNEREILLFTSQGDEKAFAQLFHHYRDRIYSVAFKLTGSEHIAEETVQDVFLKVWIKREGLTAISDFNAWLFIVARNTIYSQLRTQSRKADEIRQPYTALTSSVDEAFEEKELASLLHEAVERLPLQQRAVYRLTKDQGLSNQQVAKKLKIAPETVKKHLQYAMRRIRAYILTRLGIFF